MKKVEADFTKYQQGDTIWILVTDDQCKSIVSDWMECNYACPLNVSRSTKNKGMYVITTQNLMWACRIVQWIGYKEVTYRTVRK